MPNYAFQWTKCHVSLGIFQKETNQQYDITHIPVFLLQGVARDYERAAEAYMHAQSQSNAQAMFNLGYMHEHGHGLPLDLHLAKRYYDQAVAVDSAAKLPVMLALTSLWLRKNYADSFLVRH